MARYAVLGASLMGRVVAKDLLESEPESRVTLMDLDPARLDEVVRLLANPRLVTRMLDVTVRAGAIELLRDHEVVIGALPHARSLQAIEASIGARVPFVDLVGSKPELRRALDGAASEAGVLVIPGLGVAPGLSNVLVARGMARLDETKDAVIYVGGIPKERTPPLEYQTVYSLVSMFGIFLRPAQLWRKGEKVAAEPLSDLEILDFPLPIGRLEAFNTDGLASLTLTVSPRIRDRLVEKTLRYPGFAEKVKFLLDCGLLDSKPVQVGNATVVPRDVLIHQLDKKLSLGPQGDILVMRVVVKGTSEGREVTHTFDLVDFMDPVTGDTAMARTTCFPATIAARMIASGKIQERGVRFPEEIFAGNLGDLLLSELLARGVSINHSEE